MSKLFRGTIWPFVWRSIKDDPEILLYFLGYIGMTFLPFLFAYKQYSIYSVTNHIDRLNWGLALLGIIYLPFLVSTIMQVFLSYTVFQRHLGRNPTPWTAFVFFIKRVPLLLYLSIVKTVTLISFVLIDAVFNAIMENVFKSKARLDFAEVIFALFLAETAGHFFYFTQCLVPLSVCTSQANPWKLTRDCSRLLGSSNMKIAKIEALDWLFVLLWSVATFGPAFFFHDVDPHSFMGRYYQVLLVSFIPLSMIRIASVHIVVSKLVFLIQSDLKTHVKEPQAVMSDLGFVV